MGVIIKGHTVTVTGPLARAIAKAAKERGVTPQEEILSTLNEFTKRRPKPGELCATCADYQGCKIGRDAAEYCGGFKPRVTKQ